MELKFLRPAGNCVPADFCERNLNILAHAQAIELEIGSRCGGHGVCGGDRIRIPHEHARLFSQVTEDERKHLSARELTDGWRLACQCFPDGDSDAAKDDVEVPISVTV
jgi:ferredoxin